MDIMASSDFTTHRVIFSTGVPQDRPEDSSISSSILNFNGLGTLPNIAVEDNATDSGKRISVLSFDPSKVNKGFVRNDGGSKETSLVQNEGKSELNQFVCTVCNTHFISQMSLHSHMQYHDVQSEHAYSGDNSAETLNQYTGPKPFKCSVCDKKFYTKTNLRNHLRTHCGETPFSCTHCEKRFTYGRNLYRHIKMAHQGDNIKAASLCSRLYRAHNSAENRLVIYTGDAIKPYKCSVCSKKFRRLYRVKEHTRNHSGLKPFQCSVCHKLFSSSDILYRHIKKIHNGGLPLQPSTQNKRTMIEDDLENETMIEVGQAPVSLPEQQETDQVQFLNLGRHTEIIDVSRLAETTFGNSSAYYIDVRSDFGEPLQVQHVPQVQQVEQVHHIQHVHQETSDKAFQCSLCGDAFESSALLNKHLASHKIQVPSKCSVCKKEFRNDSYLKRHMSIHTGEKPFKCSLCPKAFYRQYRLNNHWRSHTGEKPYPCTICDKTFAVSDNMYRHIKKIHNGEGLQFAAGVVKQIQDQNREKKFSFQSE